MYLKRKSGDFFFFNYLYLVYTNISSNMYILASGQLITLAIKVSKLSTGPKVKGDFLLNISVSKKKTQCDH